MIGGRVVVGGRVAVGAVAALAVLTGCSSAKKSTPPTSTVSTSSSSSTSSTTATTSAPSSSTTPAPSSTTAPVSTTSATARPGIAIAGFTVNPATPVCSGPTMVELAWTAVGATTVGLAIDGRDFASYGGGAQRHLEYYACDGRPHTYRLTAHGPGGTATVTKVVTSTPG